MLACYIESYGGADVVVTGEQPEPKPSEGQVVFRMHAASVNPIDYKIRSGSIKALLPYQMPLILGSDASGIVTEVGPGVGDYQVGDRVAARLSKKRIGAFAEKVLAHTDQLAKIPDKVSFEEAAAVALAGLTAWQCLTEVLKVRSSERILIHAGSGGVGHLAIQLAKALGAHVTTTASNENHDWLHQLGADVCIDYKREDFTQACEYFDCVLDTQGGHTLLASIGHTRLGGRVVSIGDLPTPEVATEFSKPWLLPVFWFLSRTPRAKARARDVAYRFWFMREDGEQLAMLLDKMASGELQVKIAQEFALNQTPEALRLSESGKVKGKVVIRP